jgi:hypothetical protein
MDFKPLQDILGADQLTLEQAQALKKETRENKTQPNKDLESLMHTYQRNAEQQYYAQLQGVDLFVARVKEVFGRGREYTYKQHLRKLGDMSAQLTTMAENTTKLTSEYREKMQDTRSAMYEERKLFELNAIIYTEKQKITSQRREELTALEKQSVLGASCTTEALRLQKELLELENDIIELNHENDELAVQLTVKTSMLETQQQTYTSLQELHSNIQRQRTAFNAHYELAQAQERITAGVKGMVSARDMYMQSSVLVQQLSTLKGQLHRDTNIALPKEFALNSPRLDQKRDPSRPYWMSVAEHIRRPLYVQ